VPREEVPAIPKVAVVSEVVAAAPEVAAIPEEYLYIYTVLEL
jgi:hypothetical protein